MNLSSGTKNNGAAPSHVEAFANWLPAVPDAERARGLEPEDVYSPAQIERMRQILTRSLAQENALAQQNERAIIMSTHNNRPPIQKPHKNEEKTRALDAARELVNTSQIPMDGLVSRKEDRKSPLIQEWISVTDHLDDDDFELLLAEAKQRARVTIFVKELNAREDRPMQYAASPRNLKLTDFIEQEWVAKGFNPLSIDRKMLGAYDDKLVRAIENYEYNNGFLPEHLRFPKVGNRRSKREMSASN